MKWINIKDKLPEPDVSVLCIAKDSSGTEVMRVYYMYDEEKQKYYGSPDKPLFREDCQDNFRWETNDVTYWMPLPERPV